MISIVIQYNTINKSIINLPHIEKRDVNLVLDIELPDYFFEGRHLRSKKIFLILRLQC